MPSPDRLSVSLRRATIHTRARAQQAIKLKTGLPVPPSDGSPGVHMTFWVSKRGEEVDETMKHPLSSAREHTWTLITVTYNSRSDLETFWKIDDISAGDFHWIVVDNHSSDGSAECASDLGARVIRLPENRGFGTANNIGFRESSDQYIGFVNPDVHVEIASLPRLRTLADSGVVVAPQLLNTSGDAQPNGRGPARLSWKLGNRLNPNRYMGTYLKTASPDEVLNVDWVMGAVVMARRDTWERVTTGPGPWDENYFVYYEDSDLGERCKAAAVRSMLDGGSRWTHGWARETTMPRLKPWILEFRSMRTFYKRYPKLLLPKNPSTKSTVSS